MASFSGLPPLGSEAGLLKDPALRLAGLSEVRQQGGPKGLFWVWRSQLRVLEVLKMGFMISGEARKEGLHLKGWGFGIYIAQLPRFMSPKGPPATACPR